MNIKSVDYIIKARHYGGSAKQYLKNQQRKLHNKGISVAIHRMDDPIGAPVYARIWQGQWIAECCNAGVFVDPEEPIFFCFQCGNRANGNNCRPVIFPEDWRAIEKKILERPVNDVTGLTDNERAGMAHHLLEVEREIEENGMIGKITLPLTRSWEPGETLQDLAEQQDAVIDKWHQELRKGPAT